MCDANEKPLTEFQERKLRMVSKGYGLDANPRQWKKSERIQMDDLVTRGLIRKSGGAAWNKHGAYVKL